MQSQVINGLSSLAIESNLHGSLSSCLPGAKTRNQMPGLFLQISRLIMQTLNGAVNSRLALAEALQTVTFTQDQFLVIMKPPSSPEITYKACLCATDKLCAIQFCPHTPQQTPIPQADHDPSRSLSMRTSQLFCDKSTKNQDHSCFLFLQRVHAHPWSDFHNMGKHGVLIYKDVFVRAREVQ